MYTESDQGKMKLSLTSLYMICAFYTRYLLCTINVLFKYSIASSILIILIV